MDTHHQVGSEIRGALRKTGVIPEDLKISGGNVNIGDHGNLLMQEKVPGQGDAGTDYSLWWQVAAATLCRVAADLWIG